MTARSLDFVAFASWTTDATARAFANEHSMRGAKAQESQVEDLFDDKLLDLTVFDKRILQDTVIPCLATEYRIRAIKKEQTG
jgi:hypothetical protein